MVSRRFVLKAAVLTAAATFLDPQKVLGAFSPPPAGEDVAREAGAKLFQATYGSAPKDGKNILVSPVAAELALAQLALGASGKAALAFESFFSGPSGEARPLPQTIRNLYSAIRGTISKPEDDCRANAAYELFLSRALSMDPTFGQAYREVFGTAPQINMDFSDPRAIDEMNAWVRERTNGKVDKMFATMPTDTTSVALGTMFFKGPWAAKFDPAKTRPADFTLRDGRTVGVSMMNMYGAKAKYFEREGTYSYLELPFKNDYAFFAIRPARGKTVDDLVRDLPQILRVTSAGAHEEDFSHIAIPEMALTDRRSLTHALKNSPLAPIFGRSADYEGIARGMGAPSEVLSAAGLALTPEGGEAYGAVAVVATRGGPSGERFLLNQPSIIGILSTRPKARMPMIICSLENPAQK